MTTRRKSFKAPKAKDYDPIEVELGDEIVKCKPTMAGVDLMPIMAALDGERLVTANGSGNISATINFLNNAFLDDDQVLEKEKDENDVPVVKKESSRVRAMNELSEGGYSMRDIVEICMWLVEQYTGNPTLSPERSSDSSKKTGSGASEKTSDED